MFTTTTSTITRRAAALAAGLALTTTGFAAASADAKSPAKKHSRSCSARSFDSADGIDVPLPGGGKMRIVDLNGDGKPDVYLFDFNGDGKWDAGVVDCDRDGKFDYRWIDRNGDGKPTRDELDPLRREARPEEIACRTAKRAHKRTACRTHPERILGLRELPQLHQRAEPVAPEQPSPQQPVQPTDPQPQVVGQTPQPTTDPQPQPPNPRTPLNIEADVNGDGHTDVVTGDSGLGPNQSYLLHNAGYDEVVVGTANGATATSVGNVDNDPKDQEILVEDPNLFPNQSYGIDLDGDGDHDIIVIGTKGGAKVRCMANVDNDPNDQEVIVEDPNLFPNQSYGIDLDGDGDHDVIVVGTKS